jgi:hypothetical protein
MKLLMLVPILLLSACTTSVPVTVKFPGVPQELLNSCPDLKQTEPTNKLSDIIKVVTDNYSEYHACRIKVESWTEWYKTQKQIYENIK